ncbi:endonuclease domain-containing protein [Nocardia sp. XZ_19_385]|nr:DUF559 domain-containing protein [Nocardia sp. XZ_19_385]
MLGEEPVVFEATVPTGTYRRTPDWLHLYRRELPAGSVGEAWDLPTTSPALTLLDCVAVSAGDAADRLVDENLRRRVPPQEVADLCASGKRGTAAMRRQLREAALDFASEPERLFARALARRGVHMFPNESVGPYVCDFVDKASRTIIEIDGREFHSEPGVFRQDRRRQNSLLLDKWLILRYAAADVFGRLDECADEAAAVVLRRRRQLRHRRSR